MSPTPGIRLGSYEILAPLGAGGMGEVFRARDPRLGRDVAVKVLHQTVADDPDRLRRFDIEARAVAALNHPNVLTIYEVGTHDGHPFLATELLEGETLRTRLDAGPLSTNKALDYARQTAAGLAAAHARGIAHRDIKPENLFVTSDGRIKILDFGLAKTIELAGALGETRLQSATGVGTVVGTAGYMSPEQVRAAPVDHRSDIFSLGVVLYEMLSGRQPFRGDSAVETMHAILTEDPPEIGPADRPLPGPITQLVAHCLEKNPEERFQSARDLSFALQSLSGSNPSLSSRTAAHGLSPTDASARQTARMKWLWLAVVAIAGLVIGIAATSLMPRATAGVDLATYRFTPLATEPGVNQLPAWSPDGRTIAYVSGSSIVVRSLDADSPSTVARGITGTITTLFWFPDGARLGYVTTDGLFAVSLAGGEAERLHEDVDAAALSPDGKTLALWMTTTKDERRTFALWFASPITAEPKKYTQAFADGPLLVPTYLAWSPDGKRLAYAGYAPEPSTWIIPIGKDGAGSPMRVFPAHRWSDPPEVSWMPDSRSLVLTEGVISRTPGLWLGNVDAGSMTRLTAGVDAVAGGNVSPDGRRIAYASASWNIDLAGIPLDLSPITDVFATTRQEFGAVYVGADSIAYITDRAGQPEIRLRRLADGSERVIVSSRSLPMKSAELSTLAPSPDGSRVFFSCWDGESSSGWITPLGGPAVRVGGEDLQMFGAAWSPDGREIATAEVNAGAYAVVRRRVGSSEKPVAIPGAIPHGGMVPEWSPTGDWIAYRREDRLALVSPDGQRSKEFPSIRPAAAAWSRDGATLFVMEITPAAVLYAIDVATGQPRTVRTFDDGPRPQAPINPGVRISLSPDGRSLLTSVLRHRSDIWMLER